MFYTIFNTAHSGDSLKIKIKYSNSLEEDIYAINNPTSESLWKRQSLQFYPKTISLELKFEFSRNTSARSGFIAFDNITLYNILADGIK